MLCQIQFSRDERNGHLFSEKKEFYLLTKMNRVVFTNGCFDILHPGHIDLLERAKALGSKLIVGINSDESVRGIKGGDRPFLNQEERKLILLGLRSVDEVVIFDELTPENIIKKIKPDVLVKGGDWSENEIIGADFVRENGGAVFSLPLKDGFSSSKIVKKITGADEKDSNTEIGNTKNTVQDSLNEHQRVFENILKSDVENIETCAALLFETFQNGGKILLCGNGGSAADAQHIAAEFVGRYETERTALPAIALTTDTSALTALANDYSFERVFARQVEALASEGDCLIAISTSGNSPNVIAAVMTARKKGCRVVGMTGAKGKKLASLTDACILVPSERTARIQEGHITIAHIWCEIIDKKIAENQD
jgi:D-sedoheptulose 7-phosphate isomerase